MNKGPNAMVNLYGRAWTALPVDMISEAGRLSATKGVHTNVHMQHGLAVDGQGVCPLYQLQLPVHCYAWKTAARPGGYRHITLEEAAALNWSLHDRLLRPGELGVKCLHVIDSAACAGAYRKGRSASRQLNARCRQACAVICAGSLEPFYAWTPTHKNPADEPSSKHGVRAGKPLTVHPKPCGMHELSCP